MVDVLFHESPSNGRRDTAEKVLCYPSLSLMTKRTCYVGHGYRVLDVEFQEDASNSRRGISGVVHCCLSIIIDQSRPNLRVLWAIITECQIWSVTKIPLT